MTRTLTPFTARASAPTTAEIAEPVASGDAPLPVADGDEPDFEPDADAADPVTLEPDALPLCEPEAAALPVGDEPEVVPVAARSWEKSTEEAVCWQLDDATVVGW